MLNPVIFCASGTNAHCGNPRSSKQEKKFNEEISEEKDTHMLSNVGVDQDHGSNGPRGGRNSLGARDHGLRRTRSSKHEFASVLSTFENKENKGTCQEMSNPKKIDSIEGEANPGVRDALRAVRGDVDARIMSRSKDESEQLKDDHDVDA